MASPDANPEQIPQPPPEPADAPAVQLAETSPPVDPPPARPRRRPSLPWLTFVLIGANVALAAATAALGGAIGSENVAVLVYLGAKVNSLIEGGDFWRLVTAGFLHMGWHHLLSNMLGLLFLGSLVEAFYGRVRYLVFYTLTGTIGIACSYKLQPLLSVGASAAVFGLLGVLLAHHLKYRAYLPPALSLRLSFLLPLSLVLAFLGMSDPRIDNYGHLGGLLSGLMLGLMSESRVAGEHQGEREWLPLPAALATTVALLVYAAVGLGMNLFDQRPLALGGRAQAQGQTARAIRYYEVALRDQPEIEDVRRELGFMLTRQRRWDEARVQFRELLRRRPGDPSYLQLHYLAVLRATAELQEQGRWEEAADRFREALPLAPDADARAGIQNNLAYVLANRLKTDLPEAQALADAATTAEPDNGMYLDTLAWVLYRQGKYEDAETVQRLAVRRDSRDIEMHYHMGAIYEALGRREAAAWEYRLVVERGPGIDRSVDKLDAVRLAEAGLRRLEGG